MIGNDDSSLKKGVILAVDDTPESLRLITDILTSEGYEVRSAINGELALHAAQIEPPDLILLDINMPDMSGFEVCKKIKLNKQINDIPIIFVSALSDTKEVIQGFKEGGVDYITKPFQREELLIRVHTHLELNRLRNHLEEMVKERTQSLKESEAKLKSTLLESITAIAATVELRDAYTAGHQRRTAEIASAIAKELNWDKQKVEGIYLAGVVHDVGKIRIPAEILSKPGRLNEIEFALIKQHSEAGYDILKSIDFPWAISDIVRQHHERMDGSGYPLGLKGDAILPEARILCVADVIEAMSSHRPYRPAVGLKAALKEIQDKSGSQFDSEVVDAAVGLFQKHEYWKTYFDYPEKQNGSLNK